MHTKERAELLAVCLDEMRSGQLGDRVPLAGPEAGLAPLLEMARRVESVQHPVLSPAALSAGLARVHKGLSGQHQVRVGRTGRARRIAWALLAFLVAVLLATTGTVLAASGSLPGEPLYPVKRAAEAFRLSLTRRPASRSLLLISFAERRLEEVSRLCHEGDCPEGLLSDLGEQTEVAADEIDRVSGGNRSELLEKMVLLTERQQNVLYEVLERAPKSARPGLERALERSSRGHEQARKALEQGGKPPSTPSGPKGERTPGPQKKTGTPEPPGKEDRTRGPKKPSGP